MAKKNQGPLEIYQIKVSLRHIRPPIWRRLLVPSNLTLEQLHDVVQVAIGWDNSHLHNFRIGSKRFAIPDPEDRFLDDVGDESKARLSAVIGKVGAKAVYTYDFGDDWEHDIVVEKILAPDLKLVYPVCVAGKRSGPPEDCGGVSGYYNLMNAISDPHRPEHEEMIEWVGEDFDPEAFPLDKVNARLAFLAS